MIAPIAGDLTAVDQVIRRSLSSEVALVSQVADYIIASGGKRLRPVCLLLVAGALGPVNDRAHRLAAIIELIHTATLLHDDVVDESDLRRGRKTANAAFGNAASVLVGDFLYSRAFQMMVSVGEMPVMRVLSDATNIIAEGEVLQLMNVGNADVTEEAYLQVIRYKTAKLFEAAGILAAIASGTDETTQARMGEFGMRLGTAFQLVDDVLDYSADAEEMGKNAGDDLNEGKPTLPLLRLMQVGNAEEKALARSAIETPGSAALADVQAAFARTGALDYAYQAAVAEAGLAKALIAPLQDGEHKRVLLQLCAFAVERRA